MHKGRLYLISGPSGSGKDTVLAKVFKKYPEIRFSISSITRAMREGEVEGEKYHFISREEFEDMIANDRLLEYNEYVGNYYGTPRGPVEQAINEGREMIIEIDVNGAKQIKAKMPDAVSIFILPPSLKTLKNRLVGRGTETAEQVESRLANAAGEIACAINYDYIVVNDDLSEAVDEIITIIKGDKNRTDRQEYLINEILNNK